MYIFNSQFMYATSHFECGCVVCVCVGEGEDEGVGVLLLRFDGDDRVITRLLIW